jgi:sulfide:quinone oxidoreductase
MSSAEPLHVVVAGGGVAALEALIALRHLAGERVRLTAIAPEPEFELKALRTAEPFGIDHVHRRPVQDLTRRFGVDLRQDSLARVDPGRRTVALSGGGELGYDELVVAVGARAQRVYEHAITFGMGPSSPGFAEVLDGLEDGTVRRVAFVAPPRAYWSLPLYELALLTAHRALTVGAQGVDLRVLSPERTPLALFGKRASASVSALLAQAGIAFRGAVCADVGPGGVIRIDPEGDVARADRVVSLPALEGPRLPGLPADELGFIPVDDHCRVDGADHVHAAGDAADFPVKQGGLACQQADAVAEDIAARVVAGLEAHPFRPVLRGKLLTGHGAHYLRNAAEGAAGYSRASDFQLWSPPTKVSGRYLSLWLAHLDAAGAEVAQPVSDGDVEITLPMPSRAELRRQLTALDPYSPLSPGR